VSSDIIKPRVLKGFRDFLPNSEIRRKSVIYILEKAFEQYGFVPIDTPVLEYTEILLGKGGGETDKQVYKFQDHGNRDVSMRFDLTVPFARYMAQHRSELYLPFKRYHIGKVWRGENTQRGRFREFIQCDFDIVGIDTISADFEILLLMKAALQAIGIDKFTILVSNRLLFNRFLTFHNLEERGVHILRLIDKVQKIGEDKVRELLSEIVPEDKAAKILKFIRPEDNWTITIEKCEELSGGPSEDSEYLKSLYSYLDYLDIIDFFFFNPSVTRGLDYYTGIVFETFLTGCPEIGSVCSGGRYNNLASLYTKEAIPGVGASIGLDRLLDALDSLESNRESDSGIDVLIMCLDNDLLPHYHKMAEHFRENGISCEVYPTKKKLSQQFQLAEKKLTSFSLICGEDEYKNKTVNLKELSTRESSEGIHLDEAIRIINNKR